MSKRGTGMQNRGEKQVCRSVSNPQNAGFTIVSRHLKQAARTKGCPGHRYAANSNPVCATVLKAFRGTFRIRTTTPPLGGGETVIRRTRVGSHSLGMTQQFTAQNPASTRLIQGTPSPMTASKFWSKRTQFSIQKKSMWLRATPSQSARQNANARGSAIN